LVADLRVAAAWRPDDKRLATMIRCLLAGSDRFAGLWRTGTVEAHGGRAGIVEHPSAGDIHVDSGILMAPGSDQKVQTLMPRRGTPDAAKVDALRRLCRSCTREADTLCRPRPEVGHCDGAGRDSMPWSSPPEPLSLPAFGPLGPA
jgi:hypothetical protein